MHGMNTVKFTHFSVVHKSPERSQTVSRRQVCDSKHECTSGSRNTLSRNQQLLKTVSFSANAIADRVNDFVGDTQCQFKETCEDLVARSVAIG